MTDLDNDGDLDIFVTQMPKYGPMAYLNENGVFEAVDVEYAREYFDPIVDTDTGNVYAAWQHNDIIYFDQLNIV